MSNYIKKSIAKFKEEALAKILYDILKWLLPAIIIFASSTILSKQSSVFILISKSINISIYTLLLCGLLLITFTVIITTFFFDKKFKSLQKDNYTDELTGLKNHKALKEYLTKKINEIRNSEKALSIILIDIDKFKNFNTQFNPSTADSVLAKLGELLGNDRRITDEVFRQFLRGDEFVVVTNETNLDDAYRAAERKRNLIQKTALVLHDKKYYLTVCCGVTELNKLTDDFSSVMNRVSLALAEAKAENGKNNTKLII